MAELLERHAADRSRRSIAKLLQLAPEGAERLLPEGSTEEVRAADLKAGDRIRVRPGDRIGADGRILTGTSAVNEAAITGESVPVAKGPGDTVFSGTMNTEGSLDIEVTADARHSVVARSRFGRVRTTCRCGTGARVAIVDAIAGDRRILKVDDVARRFGLNPRRMQRLFSKYVGVNPKWVIQRYRLHEPTETAGPGDARQSALALELGYADQAHFVKDFKSIVGTAPAAYAKRARESSPT